MYTNDCKPLSEQATYIKFSDDTAIVDKSESQSSFENEVEHFVGWCDSNFLDLNVQKTDEMVAVYGYNKEVEPLKIKGQTVRRVTEYKYLGNIIDCNLSFNQNSEAIFKKCRQRMHVLYTLRAFNVNQRIMERCYKAFIQSVLTFSLVCWFGSLCERERKRPDGIVRVCGKIVGTNQQTLQELFCRQARGRAARIISIVIISKRPRKQKALPLKQIKTRSLRR